MQKAFNFDKETVRKIFRGAWHSALVGILIISVDTIFKVLGTVTVSDPMMAAVYSMVCANIYNIAKEYIKGIEDDKDIY